jgi:two-component system, chemotaxis family, chemotaxis protein CheY
MTDRACDVLVVDDDRALREGLIELFRMEGIPAQGAGNGLEALSLLSKGLRPLVILLDLDMPGLNGWGVVEGLSRNVDFANIPLVIMSGVVAEERSPLRKGDLGFFRKPLNFDGVLARVRTVVRGGDARRTI